MTATREERPFACAMCGARVLLVSRTTRDPEAPEMFSAEPGVWCGLVRGDVDIEMVVVCSESCCVRLLGDRGEDHREPVALRFIRQSVARAMRKARETAQLSHVELAEKIRMSEASVRGVEAETLTADEHYVAAVLKACGLPADWKEPGR